MEPRYDPDVAPAAIEWLDIDEGEKCFLVEAFHRRRRIRIPNERLHALVHVIVENQVAAADELPVAATLARLRSEGLSRHEALHAIGSVLADHIRELVRDDHADSSVHAVYFERVKALTADAWLESVPP